MVSPAKHRANEKYNNKAYEDVRLRLKVGQKELLKAAADQAGMSVNAFIVLALEKQMGLDFSNSSPSENE